MNLQSKSPKDFPVNVTLVKQLMIRIMTRNEKDRLKAAGDRKTLMENMETLNSAPEHHLAFVLQMLDKFNQIEQPPTFEAGLIFGISMTLCARGANGQMMLRKMLADVEKQQESDQTPPTDELKSIGADVFSMQPEEVKPPEETL